MYKCIVKKIDNGEIKNQAIWGTSQEIDAWKAVILARNSEVSAGLVSNPKIYDFEITNLTEQNQQEAAIQAKIDAGRTAREACQKVLDYTAGANLDRDLTIQQITDMQTIFAQAEAALRAGRPNYAKLFILSIEPDGVLVTEELKSTCLQFLANY